MDFLLSSIASRYTIQLYANENQRNVVKTLAEMVHIIGNS